MPAIVSDALVLRTYPLGETSKVVVLLTRERGKLRAVAKGARGARPRYRSALEPMSEVRVSLHGRQGADLFRLGECDLVRSAFAVAGRDVEHAAAVAYVAELLDAFAPEAEAEDAVYRLALAVLEALTSGTTPSLLERYTEAWLLKLHGIYPPLDACAGCGTALGRGALAYHAAAHGFVCEACGPATGPMLSATSRVFLAEMFRQPPARVPAECPEPARLEGFHRELITRHLERPLRSTRARHEILREPGEARG